MRDEGIETTPSPYSLLPIFFALLLVLLPLLSGGSAYAQASRPPQVTVEAQSAMPHFPDKVDFALNAHGFETVHASLNYRLVGEPVTEGLEADVSGATPNLDLKVALDLSTHYIPPGAEVSYYWTLKGKDTETETPEKTFVMPDDRYKWNSMADAQKRVTVHWYEGDRSFGTMIRDNASNALDRLQRDIGANQQRPTNVWVYATQDDLIGALPQNIPEWVGGKAFPDLALVLAAISSKVDTDTEIKRVIPHELSHLLLYQATYNPYNTPPAWFDEGLAVHNQQFQDPTEEQSLKQAAEDGSLKPLKALSGSFGASEDEAVLSYAESRSAVDFLLSDNRYGPAKFAKTVTAFHEGVTYDDALKAGLGATVDEINQQWRASLPYKVAAPNTTPNVIRNTLPNLAPIVLIGLGVFVGLLIAGVFLAIVALRRSSRIK